MFLKKANMDKARLDLIRLVEEEVARAVGLPARTESTSSSSRSSDSSSSSGSYFQQKTKRIRRLLESLCKLQVWYIWLLKTIYLNSLPQTSSPGGPSRRQRIPGGDCNIVDAEIKSVVEDIACLRNDYLIHIMAVTYLESFQLLG